MRPVFANSNKMDYRSFAPLFWMALAGFEFLIVKIFGAGQFTLDAGNPQKHAGNLIYIGHFITYLVLIAAGFVFINAFLSNKKDVKQHLYEYAPSKTIIGVNVISFIMLLVLIYINRTYYHGATEPTYTWAILTALPFKFVLLCTFPFLIMPTNAWLQLFDQYFTLPVKLILLLILVLSPNDKNIAMYIGSHLILPTIHIAQYLYKLGGGELSIKAFDDEGYPVIGDDTFVVDVRPTCSGYEGITLIILFLILFLPLLRRAYSKFQVFLIGLGCLAATFLMNSVRIALMMYVGEHISDKVAVNGFHTHFGIFSLLTIACICMAFVAKKQSIFSSNIHNVDVGLAPLDQKNHDFIMLLPMVVTLGSSIILGMFEDGFNWLYPAPILLGSLALISVWKKIDVDWSRIQIVPVVVGVIVFGIWIFLIPENKEYEQKFVMNLYEYGHLRAIAWLVIRALGSSLFIPIAEELAFRGVLWNYIEELLDRKTNRIIGNIIVLGATSVCFGLLHSDIVAAVIAGLAYGALRLSGYGVLGPIVAHVVTNSMISFYVIVFSAWSYW